MNKLLKKIKEIDPDNSFIAYFLERIKKDNYRGVHFSQHNRKDLEFLVIVLDAIFKVAKDNFFEIPRGDYEKESNLDDNFDIFTKIVDNIKQDSGKMTINSFKKNILVDFDRMGFLNRYDKNKKEIKKKNRTPIHFCKISELGIHVLEAENLFERYRLFTQGLDKYFWRFSTKFSNKNIL